MKTLKEAYKDYFKIGAAVNVGWFEKCRDIIINNFDSITCENEMKYASVYSEESKTYNFDNADKLYSFAMDNGLEIRGHNFVWHQQNITEEQAKAYDPDSLRARIREHMTVMSERYPDVSCWDVINEAIDDKHGEFLRDTVWKRILGDSYYIEMFALAREIIPDKPLVYNDYNEYIPAKRDNIVRLVTDLKERGLIDAVGMQGHHNVPECFTLDEIKRTIETYAALGLKLYVTEMDVSCPPINVQKTANDLTPQEIEAHAKLYGDLFAVYREYAEHIESVTLWGVSDNDTWLNYAFRGNGRNALLFGRDYKPNEAYMRVVDF